MGDVSIVDCQLNRRVVLFLSKYHRCDCGRLNRYMVLFFTNLVYDKHTAWTLPNFLKGVIMRDSVLNTIKWAMGMVGGKWGDMVSYLINGSFAV